MVVNDFVRSVLALNCFGSVSTVGDNQVSEATRIFGYDFNENSGVFTALVFKEGAEKLINCFNKTKKIACVISDPFSHQTLQFKGEYISSADATQEETDLIKNNFQPRVKEILAGFGMPDSFADVWKYQPTLSIKMQCKEIFDQTPRMNTGIKISQV